MDLSVIFLGTGGSVPSARRSTASVLIARGGDRLLFDCGEGTQRQLQRSLGLVQVDEIYLTHFHADHILGLPGLLKTYDLTDREAPLTVYGPRGLRALMGDLRRIYGKLTYEVRLAELGPNDAVALDGYRIGAYEVTARVRAVGYALVEDERPGRFDPARAAELGVEPGPQFGLLQRGRTRSQGEPAGLPTRSWASPGPAARSSSPATPSPARRRSRRRRDAELLVHDATFAEEEAQRAAETGHSTVGQAASVAREAHVKMLALAHISSSTTRRSPWIEQEARAGHRRPKRDFDVIEVPLPERRRPQLVPERSRKRETARRLLRRRPPSLLRCGRPLTRSGEARKGHAK